MTVILGIIGTVLTAVWVLLYLMGSGNKKYAAYIEGLNKELFLMCDIYFIGFTVLDRTHNRCNQGFFAKNMKKMEELFGEKYAAFYNYVLWAGKITLCLTLVPVMIFTGLLAGETIISWMGIIVGPVIAMSLDSSVTRRVEERREAILMDFPQVISKLAMLLNAGMTLQDAWQQIAFSRQTALYQEMQTATLEIQKAGVGTEEAYLRFARRCGIPEVRKFASLVIQNMKKGGADMVYALSDMADERWQQKKHIVLRKGELAGNQLLMPIMLMFVGVMMLILVPAFASMQF